MTVGRNDPCPCGSGKKYKKCCWARDQQQRAAYIPAPEPEYGEETEDLDQLDPDEDPDYRDDLEDQDALEDDEFPEGPGGFEGDSGGEDDDWEDEESEDEEPEDDDWEDEESEDEPADPLQAERDALWEDFDQRPYEGKIALFDEALGRAGFLDSDLAFEMLEAIRGEAVERDDLDHFESLVGRLKETLPDVYAEDAGYFLSWTIEDLVARGRFDEVREPSLEYARHAAGAIDTFEHDLDILAYHGQLDLLVEMFRLAWSGVKEDPDIFEWAVDEFGGHGLRWEVLSYCEHAPSPQPDDPQLVERLKAAVPEYDPAFVRTFMDRVLGRAQEPPRPENVTKPGKSGRSPQQEKRVMKAWANWAQQVAMEFLGFWYREYGVSYSKATLAFDNLSDYLVRRLYDDLDRKVKLQFPGEPPKPAGKGKRGTKSQPVHVLCPDRTTLDPYLAHQISFMNWRYHRAGALVEALPAWLRYLESRRMIDAEEHAAALADLRPLQRDLLKSWKDLQEYPLLYQAVLDAWREADQRPGE